MSLKRLGPSSRSRTRSSAHRSPITSSDRATPHRSPYERPLAMPRSLADTTVYADRTWSFQALATVFLVKHPTRSGGTRDYGHANDRRRPPRGRAAGTSEPERRAGSSSVEGARAAVPGVLHGHPRLLDRGRGGSLDPTSAGVLLGPPAVGVERLLAGVRRP